MSIKDVISDTNDTDNTRRIIERNDIALCGIRLMIYSGS